MTYDPDDKRALFQRVVDDIIEQIEDGQLKGGDRLPSAKEIGEQYDVSAMTAQRALRELQTQGLTYGMAGKGTFVRPDAQDKIKEEENPYATAHAGVDGVYRLYFDEAMFSDDAEEMYEREFDKALAEGLNDVEAGRQASREMMRYARKVASNLTAEHMDALIEHQRTTPTSVQAAAASKAKTEAAKARAKERRAAKRTPTPKTGE